jgi:hypothetical protein
MNLNGLSDNVFHQAVDAGGGGGAATTTSTPTDPPADKAKAEKLGFEDKGIAGGIRVGTQNITPMVIETEAVSSPDYRWIGQAGKMGLTIDALIGPAWATGKKNNGYFSLQFGPSYSYNPYKLDYRPSYNPDFEGTENEQDSTTRLQVHRLALMMQGSYLTRLGDSDMVAGGHVNLSAGGLFYANVDDRLFISDRGHEYNLSGDGRFKSPWSLEVAAGGDIGHKNARFFAEFYARFQPASAAMNELGRGREFWDNPANAFDYDSSSGGVGAIWAHPEGAGEFGIRLGGHFGAGPKVQAPAETKEPEPEAPVETRDPR